VHGRAANAAAEAIAAARVVGNGSNPALNPFEIAAGIVAAAVYAVGGNAAHAQAAAVATNGNRPAAAVANAGNPVNGLLGFTANEEVTGMLAAEAAYSRANRLAPVPDDIMAAGIVAGVVAAIDGTVGEVNHAVNAVITALPGAGVSAEVATAVTAEANIIVVRLGGATNGGNVVDAVLTATNAGILGAPAAYQALTLAGARAQAIADGQTAEDIGAPAGTNPLIEAAVAAISGSVFSVSGNAGHATAAATAAVAGYNNGGPGAGGAAGAAAGAGGAAGLVGREKDAAFSSAFAAFTAIVAGRLVDRVAAEGVAAGIIAAGGGNDAEAQHAAAAALAGIAGGADVSATAAVTAEVAIVAARIAVTDAAILLLGRVVNNAVAAVLPLDGTIAGNAGNADADAQAAANAIVAPVGNIVTDIERVAVGTVASAVRAAGGSNANALAMAADAFNAFITAGGIGGGGTGTDARNGITTGGPYAAATPKEIEAASVAAENAFNEAIIGGTTVEKVMVVGAVAGAIIAAGSDQATADAEATKALHYVNSGNAPVVVATNIVRAWATTVVTAAATAAGAAAATPIPSLSVSVAVEPEKEIVLKSNEKISDVIVKNIEENKIFDNLTTLTRKEQVVEEVRGIEKNISNLLETKGINVANNTIKIQPPSSYDNYVYDIKPEIVQEKAKASPNTKLMWYKIVLNINDFTGEVTKQSDELEDIAIQTGGQRGGANRKITLKYLVSVGINPQTATSTLDSDKTDYDLIKSLYTVLNVDDYTVLSQHLKAHGYNEKTPGLWKEPIMHDDYLFSRDLLNEKLREHGFVKMFDNSWVKR
jgi:hypothetical protein